MTKPSLTNERENMFTEQVTIKLTPAMKKTLLDIAEDNGVKLSTVTRSMISYGLSYFNY